MDDKYACHNLSLVKQLFSACLRRRGSVVEAYNDCVARFPDSMLAK